MSSVMSFVIGVGEMSIVMQRASPWSFMFGNGGMFEEVELASVGEQIVWAVQ